MTQEDWIEWNGGECPVEPDACVDIRFRDGIVTQRTCAGSWDDDNPAWSNWQHDQGTSDDDIIAYRVVKS
jgi:hypothetical protein